jgi:hypothetical protein
VRPRSDIRLVEEHESISIRVSLCGWMRIGLC